MSQFKPGDRVRVVIPTRKIPKEVRSLPLGTEYVIKRVDKDGYVDLEENPHGRTDGWFPSRFEKVGTEMTTKYPTNLQVGDVMINRTGRKYTVTNVDSDARKVTYAYVPATSRSNEVALSTVSARTLHWIRSVKRGSDTVWPVPNIGAYVRYKGLVWNVTDHHGQHGLRLQANAVVDASEVEVN